MDLEVNFTMNFEGVFEGVFVRIFPGRTPSPENHRQTTLTPKVIAVSTAVFTANSTFVIDTKAKENSAGRLPADI